MKLKSDLYDLLQVTRIAHYRHAWQSVSITLFNYESDLTNTGVVQSKFMASNKKNENIYTLWFQ